MDIKTFSDLFDVGLHPIPLLWNTVTRQADVYPEHQTDIQSGNGKPDLNDVKRWLGKISNANAIALKLYPPFFMFDFDLKNTADKNIYQDWFRVVEATNSDVLRKLCIEKTRSGGVHVYAKYTEVSHKKMLASSDDGKEVISIYTGGLLSFCYPTPGYELIHNDFSDIDDLTTEEFDLLTAAAIHFNKYTPKGGEYTAGEVVEYPVEYESIAFQFDKLCTDELFEQLLNTIDLYQVPGKVKSKNGFSYYLYLRQGSTAAFSAKVCFDPKRLFIFSGSFQKFPNFHTRINEADKSWRLTPTRLLYYIYNKDWGATTAAITDLCRQFGVEIATGPPVSKRKLVSEERLKFPYDIFPEEVQQYISCQLIQHEYLAGSLLSAFSTAIGNTAVLYAMPGYKIKPILYLALVAPPGASKSPALTKSFAPLEEYDNQLYKKYEQELVDYTQLMKDYEKNKKTNEKPDHPIFPQILIKDSTIEMVVKILSFNKSGCCVLADELVGFLNRMNQYKSGDEVQKWLEMWSGSPVLLQRITREVNKVEDPFCSVVGGIQPGVLESLSKEENQFNGFYHRFLFVYPEPQSKVSWQQLFVPPGVEQGFIRLFNQILLFRTGEQAVYYLSEKANDLYKEWFDYKNQYYNRSDNDNVKGIIAKYQDYCLRFALIIQVLQDAGERTSRVAVDSVERAIRLTEYFLGNMHKALRVLAPETPADRLQGKWNELYSMLPEQFTAKKINSLAESLGIKIASTKSFLLREQGKLFRKTGRNEYEKLF